MYVRIIDQNAFPNAEMFSTASVSQLKAFTKLFSSKHFKIYGLFQNDHSCFGFWYMFHYTKWGIRFCITPPGFPNIGLNFINASEKNSTRIGTHNDIFELIANTIHQSSPDYTELTFPTEFQDMQALVWSKFTITPKYTYHLNLKQDTSALLSEMSSELRRSIQNFNYDTVHIRQNDNVAEVNSLLAYYSKQKRLKLSTPQSIALMDIYRQFNTGVLYTAYTNSKLIAFAFFKTELDKAQYVFGAHVTDGIKGIVPNVFWKAITDFKALNFSILDFEGSMIPEVERFYRKFGGLKVIQFCATRFNFKALIYIWIKRIFKI
jgi:hypothetical protein